MIYICNFYAHKREGVSNQIELLRAHTNGYLFAAGIFLKQKHLAYEDIQQKRIILSEKGFVSILPNFVKSLPKNECIHYFSEEPEKDKLKIFNSVPNGLYISMYRRPSKKYAIFLKKFKNLIRIYVELEQHKKILVKFGIQPSKIIVSNTPAMFERSLMNKNFGNRYLFASWNKGDHKSLKERGLVAILNFLEANPSCTCKVLLRDDEIHLYQKMIKKKELNNKITLSNIDYNSKTDLHKAFADTDIILFLMEKKLTKDVPNSIIDGFSLGKPVIMTNVIDFSKIVKDHDMGWIIHPAEIFDAKIIKKTYNEKSRNAFEYSKKTTRENYVKAVISGYIK